MWKHELAVQFRKGFGFMTACDHAAVPADRIDDARALWSRWDVIAAARRRGFNRVFAMPYLAA